MFTEVKYEIGNDAERLDAIAQVIAEYEWWVVFPMPDVVFYWFESTVCEKHSGRFDIPVIGILCDGMSFEFFLFDGKTRKFTRGCLPGDPAECRRGLRLANFTLDGPACFSSNMRDNI